MAEKTQDKSGYVLRYNAPDGTQQPAYFDNGAHRLMALTNGVLGTIDEAVIVRTDDITRDISALLHYFYEGAPANLKGRLKKEITSYKKGDFYGHLSLDHEYSYGWSSNAHDNAGWEGSDGLRGQVYSATASFHHILTELKLSLQALLSLVGEGGVVTFSSLSRGCSKDQKRARFLPGDTVSWNKGKRVGVIKSLSVDSANIIDSAGKKATASYKAMAICTKEENKTDFDSLPMEQMSLFLSVMKDCTLYRAKEERMSLDHPFMSGKNTVLDAQVFKCPNCGGPAEASKGYGEDATTTRCIMCGQSCVLMGVEDGVGLLMVFPKPHRNQFCLEEAKCCNNCGVFHFESGREGKRSTGYCRNTNLCVQAHNTCRGWMPRDPSRYSRGISQHCTNLGYGLKDNRNLDRNENTIEDLVYREEDHALEKKRAVEAVRTYNVAYQWFRQQLSAMASKLPVESLFGEIEDGQKV